MSRNRPIKTKAKQIGEVASAHMALYFKKLGWNYRPQEDQNDFGIDAEVEIVNSNLVTGTIFKCQIKGCESLRWKSDSLNVHVKSTTFKYWCSYGVPVIALLVDNQTGEAFWSLPLAHRCGAQDTAVPIWFTRNNRLSSNGSNLSTLARSWHQYFSHYNILTEVPHFHRIHQKLFEMVDWGDKWVDIGEELDAEARFFYKHVVQLRLSLGLEVANIIPLDDFYIRNSGIWSGDRILYHGTFSELIKYLDDFYEEALAEVKRRLANVRICFENREVYNYFKLDPRFALCTNIVEIQYEDPRANDPTWHEKIEKQLKEKNALRACWVKGEIY